jgi:hypothetical protein
VDLLTGEPNIEFATVSGNAYEESFAYAKLSNAYEESFAYAKLSNAYEESFAYAKL